MVCNNCGTLIADGVASCPVCGTVFSSQPVSEPQPEQQVDPVEEVAFTAPEQMPQPEPIAVEPIAVEPQPEQVVQPEPVVQPAPVYVVPQPQPQPVPQPQPIVKTLEQIKAELENAILTFGILAAALSSVPILGIIFGIIARKKAKQYQTQYGILPTKSVVGNVLGLVGLITGIVSLVVSFVVIIVYCIVFAMIGIGLDDLIG